MTERRVGAEHEVGVRQSLHWQPRNRQQGAHRSGLDTSLEEQTSRVIASDFKCD